MTSAANDMTLKAELAAVPGAAPAAEREDGWWIEGTMLDVPEMGRTMFEREFRLVTMTGKPTEAGETIVMYHFAKGSQLIHFRTVSRNAMLPSLATMSAAAGWAEREIHDFFAVTFDGHPNLVPLFRPEGMPEGFFRDSVAQPAASGDN